MSGINKAELVEEIVNQTGLTKREFEEALGAITSVMTNALAREEKVTLVDFGTFKVMGRKAGSGANPQITASVFFYFKTMKESKRYNK